MAKKSSKAPKQPASAEEFLAAGVAEEDHGDRWLGSDHAKALRFYSKAISDFYTRAMVLDGGNTPISVDAAYNTARIQFLVYNELVKTQIIDEAPDDSGDVVVRPLRDIAASHKKAVDLCTQVPNADTVDIFFNYAQVLAELADDDEVGEYEQLFNEAFAYFERVVPTAKAPLGEVLDLVCAYLQAIANYWTHDHLWTDTDTKIRARGDELVVLGEQAVADKDEISTKDQQDIVAFSIEKARYQSEVLLQSGADGAALDPIWDMVPPNAHRALSMAETCQRWAKRTGQIEWIQRGFEIVSQALNSLKLSVDDKLQLYIVGAELLKEIAITTGGGFDMCRQFVAKGLETPLLGPSESQRVLLATLRGAAQ